MSQLIDTTEPVARKRHVCEDCGRWIEAGEKYSRQFLIGDDGPYTWKRCAHCVAFWGMYYSEIAWDYWEGAGPDDVVEWEPVTAESIEHKRQFRAKWADHTGALYPVPTAVAA